MLFTGDKTFESFGVGDDDRRRRRRPRLADRPAGAALEARRPRRQGAHPVPRRACAARTARAASGTPCSNPVLKHPLVATIVAAGGAARARRIPALQMHTVDAGPGDVPEVDPGDEGVRPRCRRRSRAAASPRVVMVKADNDLGRAGPRGDRQAAARRRRDGPVPRAHVGRASTRTARSRSCRCRSPAPAPTPRRTRALETLRDDVIPATLGSLGDADVGVAGLTAELVRLQQADEACARRSCSRSCSHSRSSCC